jgi:tryptophan-rich sensory protein
MPRTRSFVSLIAFLVIVFLAAGIGGLATAQGNGGGSWYDALDKPAGTPPSWVFGPVWTVLYILMAVAAWRVWQVSGLRAARWSMVLFFVQLALNATWSVLFFGAHEIGWAFVELVVLWVAIASTLAAFLSHSGLAAGLFAPYLLWVSYAGWLNLRLWQLN